MRTCEISPVTPRFRLALVLALSLALAAGCTEGGESSADDRATTSSPSGPTERPGDGRPRVVLGGDSVMGNLAPGVIAGLGDRVDAHYLAQARISGDVAARQAWSDTIEEEDPQLVVIHVGSWEVLSPGFDPGDPDWFERYARQSLDPFVDLVTSGGARVLFIGPAAARDEQRTVNLISLNSELVALADRNPDVDFLNAGTYVNDPTGGFTETLPGPGGVPVRIRRTDELGLHLCPAGVVRLATPVLAWISGHLDEPVPPVEGWDHAAWSRPPDLEKPEQCPPVT